MLNHGQLFIAGIQTDQDVRSGLPLAERISAARLRAGGRSMNGKPIHLLTLAGALGLAVGVFQEARAEGGGTQMELKGTVTELAGTCPALEFMIGEQKIMTHSGTDFDENCQEVTNGRLLEVKGHVGTDQVLMAREVDLD